MAKLKTWMVKFYHPTANGLDNGETREHAFKALNFEAAQAYWSVNFHSSMVLMSLTTE